MDWFTWETGNILYFIPGVLLIIAWSWASFLFLIFVGAVVLSYPFLMPMIGNMAQDGGADGYVQLVSWMLWLAGVTLFLVSAIGKAFRIWGNERLRNRSSTHSRNS